MIVELPPLHPGQRLIQAHPARFKVAACARRWGKTRLGALLALEVGMRKGRAWWVAPSYRMSAVGWRLVRQLAHQIPGSIVREGDQLIKFPGGGTLQVRSADKPDSLRGEGLDFVVLDECAYMAEAAWSEALRPALSDRQGKAIFISTPKGRSWFWRAWMRGHDGGDSEWAAWQFPTANNPHIQPGEIEAARRSLPERIFAQEYLAQFLDDSAAVFRHIMEAATASPQEKAIKGRQYVIGCDWAKHNDYTVLAVLDVAARALVHLDRFNQIDYQVQIGRLRGLCQAFNPQVVIAEQNSIGDALIEQLQRAGLPVVPFNTTNASKTAIIDSLALAFEQGTIQIIPDEHLIAELQAFEMERFPSGLLRYNAPAGIHDDCVLSLAMCWAVMDAPANGGMVVIDEDVQISPF